MLLEKWVKNKKLKYKELIKGTTFELEGVDACFYIVNPKLTLISKEMRLIIGEDEHLSADCDFFVFEWGGKWYYEPENYEKISFTPLENFGLINQSLNSDNFPFLGLHSAFELYNGSGIYKNWIKRAKFLGYKSISIAERNTLAGVLYFQEECKKNEIKSIIGEEITVKKNNIVYYLKLYVKNEIGWNILLKINKEINVINSRPYIDEEKLVELLNENIIVVFDKSIKLSDNLLFEYSLAVKSENLFYQIDTTIYKNNTRDGDFLNIQKHNLLFYKNKNISFALINDSYYVNKEDFDIKKRLNEMNPKGEIEDVSENQYLKDLDDNFELLSPLFKKEDELFSFFEEIINNAIKIEKKCSFQYKVNGFRLPTFTQDHLLSEIKKETNNELFWSLIEKGIQNKLIERDKIKDLEPYFKRIEKEAELIQKWGFIDYFLVLWDIIRYSHENDILVGPGRGSSAGSIISYLFNITNIDPIKFNLIFERFLNQGRIDANELPDIDSDFASEKRPQIKQYLEDIYGKDQVCSVGTYGTFQLISGIKDLLRNKISFQTINSITKWISFPKNETISLLFETAIEKSSLKKLLKENVHEINQLASIYMGAKNKSIHAAAMIIAPKEHGDIYSQIPIRKQDGHLVSEWEGYSLADIGFLKEDLLGTNQLNKFSNMIRLIEKINEVNIDFYNIPLDNKEVYSYYKKGWTADNFHFGSNLMTAYILRFQPDELEDLIAAMALVRPGTLDTGSADKYIAYKKHPNRVKYLPGLEEITKNTFGIILYQEQVMKICQEIGGFSLTEADGIRKAIGKKKMDLIKSFKEKFITGSISFGNKKEDSEKIWELMEAHGSYSFNRSHSVAYAITGYYSQWFKVNYPLAFWITTFQYADKDKLARYISELNLINGKIQLKQTDINLSKNIFYYNGKNDNLYWSIDKVKMAGEVSLQAIQEERELGKFKSFSDFIKRIKTNKRKVNKSLIENLIYAGAFDQVEEVEEVNDRVKIMNQIPELLLIKEKDLNINKEPYLIDRNWWWNIQQKNISDFAYFDYKKIIIEVNPHLEKSIEEQFLNGFSIIKGERNLKSVISAGIVVSIRDRPSKDIKDKRYPNFGKVLIDMNFEEYMLTIWNKAWTKFKDRIKVGDLIIFSGIVKHETHGSNFGIVISTVSMVKILR